MPNKISFECTHCFKSIGVDAKYAGRKGKCKACGTTLEVPFAKKNDATFGSNSALDPVEPKFGLDLITREQVLQALDSYSEETNHGFGIPTKYQLVFEGKRYPPKAVVGIAYRFAAGRVLSPSEFSGGNQKGQANFILRELGFEVVSTTEEDGEAATDLFAERGILDESPEAIDSRNFESGETTSETSDQNGSKSGGELADNIYSAAIGTTIPSETKPRDFQTAVNDKVTSISTAESAPHSTTERTVASAVQPEDFEDLSLEAKLKFFRELYGREENSEWSKLPVSALVDDDDSHLAQIFLDMRIADLVNMSASRIRLSPGVGEGRIKRLCRLLGKIQDPNWTERFIANAGSIAGAGFKFFGVEDKLAYLRSLYSQEAFEHWNFLPITTLVDQSDRHLPQAFLNRRIGDFLKLSTRKILQEPGVGEGRLHKLCDVLIRVAEKPGVHEHPIISAPAHKMPQIEHERRSLPIESVMLAKLTSSLNDVSANTWHLDVCDLLSMTEAEITEIPGIGPAKSNEIIEQLERIRKSFNSARSGDSEYCLTLTRMELQKIENWFFDVLVSDELPSVLEFRINVVDPILGLIERDFDEEMRQIVEARLGLNEPPKTFLELGDIHGLTRERIRQKIVKAAYSVELRFPRGKVLFELLAARSERNSSSIKLNSLIRECSFIFASSEKNDQSEQRDRPSASEILSAWAIQGKEHQTPFSHAELIQWISDSFPGVIDNFAFDLIASDALVAKSPNGNTIFLTNRIEDRAYAYLLNAAETVNLSELAEELDRNDRSLIAAISPDQRMAVDDDHNVILLEDIGFRRHDGKWFLNLSPIQDSPDLDNEVIIPVDTLVNCVLSGLPKKDVFDATVWGVFRFVNELLEYEYRSVFPLGVNEIILADVLVAHSKGRIRNMRRRRLRWNGEQGPSALGKNGWVSKVVNKVNMAITVDELDEALREHYQDYAGYVLDQLASTDEEDGDNSATFEVLKIPRSGLPVIISPANSKLTREDDPASLLTTSVLSSLSETEIHYVIQAGNHWVNAVLDRGTKEEGDTQVLHDTDHIPQSYVPLLNAVAEILARNDEPMRISEIRRELSAKGVQIPGQGKDANIIVYLRQSSDFCRTAVGTYALSAWGLPTIDKPKTEWKSTTTSTAKPPAVFDDDADLTEEDTLLPTGSRMQIYEAAHKVLLEASRPTHVDKIYELIVEKGYFDFGAKNPISALSVAIDRHANNVGISRPAEPLLFYRHSPATYALIEWQSQANVEMESNPANLDDLQFFVGGTKPEVWFALSRWAKVNDELQPKERSLAYSIGRVLSNGNSPSTKQAKWAVDILERAKQAGFDPADAKPKEKTVRQQTQKPDARTDNVNDVLASFILDE